jgi:hypothetical protein
MKRWLVGIASLVAVDARGDVFGFKDAPGFEKCMQLDHLLERVGDQARLLGPEEIQPRCIEAAARLVARTRDKTLGFDCVAITKRETAPVMALDVIAPLVDLSLAACNEMEIYEVLLRPLSTGADDERPKAKATAIIRRCLRDGTFRKDFADERTSGDDTRAKNACRILIEEKVVRSCK